MQKNTNLRFFLALGNTKMVLLEEDQEVKAYTSSPAAGKSNIRMQRIKDAVSSR